MHCETLIWNSPLSYGILWRKFMWMMNETINMTQLDLRFSCQKDLPLMFYDSAGYSQIYILKDRHMDYLSSLNFFYMKIII